MSDVVINISWEYFLGITGLFVLGAWYTNGRFTALETSITWIKDSITKLEGRMDNAFGSGSPVKLLEKGVEVLEQSGLKEYVNANVDKITSSCQFKNTPTNQYDIQESAFECFDKLDFGDFESKLKEAAYKHGMSLETVRRIGGIYFRDILLSKNGFTPEDLDKPKN